MALRAVDEGFARAKAVEEIAEGGWIGGGAVEDGKGEKAGSAANGRRFGEFGGEVDVVGEFSGHFVREKATADNEIVRNCVVRGFAAEEADEVPDAAGVEEKRQEQEPTPEWKRAVRPFSENAMSANGVSDANREEIGAKPNGEKKPAALRDADRDEEQSEECQEVAVFHWRKAKG